MFASGVIRYLQRVRTFLQRKKLYKSQRFVLTATYSVLFLLTLAALSVQNSFVITVDKNGQAQEVITEAETVQELLAELDIEPKAKDFLSHNLHTPLSTEMTISWRESVPIELELYGELQQVWTTEATIEEMLHEQKIKLQDGDLVSPHPALDIEENMTVEVAHYETEIVEQSVKIDYETVRKEDPTLVKGEERVLSSGSNGEITHRFYVTYKNGEEVQRRHLDFQQEEEAEERLIAVGTKEEQESEAQPESKPKSHTATASADASDSPDSSTGSSAAADTGSSTEDSGSSAQSADSSSSASSASTSSTATADDSDSSSGRGNAMQVQSTAYTANCSGCSGITATGINLSSNPNKKVIAVDPNVIPLGSTVEVEGYGTAVAGDTGGNIQGKHIDVHVPSESEARSWGNRTVTIRVLD